MAFTSQAMPSEEVKAAALRKAKGRILPYIFLLYIIAFVDRVNVGFAKLRMATDLGFSNEVIGFGAGIFFIGYVVLEIPGTWIVERWSARKWIARIMITWGIFTIVNAFIHTEKQFYITRFCIGLAEAGFFPGMIVYLSHWFTARERARAVAFFMSAIPISNIIAGPISGAIIDSVNWWGLAGWRWLFILEGIPALIFGVLTLFVLVDWPHQASWLTEEEKKWLTERFQMETKAKQAVRHYRVSEVFREREVLLLMATYFLQVVGAYGITIWSPTIVAQLSGQSSFYTGLLNSLIYLAGLVALIVVGRRSDQTGERKFHTAIPFFISSLGLIGSVMAPNPAFSLIGLMVAISGIYSSYGPFWAMPTQFLSAESAAVAIGLINSVGNLGGFVGPYVVGKINTSTGSFFWGFAFLSVSVFLAGLCALQLQKQPHLQSRVLP